MSQLSKITRSASILSITAVLCSAQLANAQDGGIQQAKIVPANASSSVIQVPVAPVLDAAGNAILPATGLSSTAGIFALTTTLAIVGIVGAIGSGNNNSSTTTTTTTN